jgi:1-acyl-sn-glycerol-3-phosphate acyltransferase
MDRKNIQERYHQRIRIPNHSRWSATSLGCTCIIPAMFRKIIAAGRMIFVCSFMAAYLIIVGTPVLTYCRIISDPRLALYLTKVLDRMVLFFAAIRIEVLGLEKLDPHRGSVYVGNHRSHVDGAALFLLIPGDVRFLIKREVFRIPMVSFALRTMGMIEVDRSDPEAAAKSIDRAVSEIQSGRSVILFPEGTRSRTANMLPFKKGAFVLAIKSQAPVVPFTIIDAEDALPPDTILLYGGKVKLIFHDPIETKGMDLEQRQELLEKVQEIVERPLVGNLNIEQGTQK